jgi:hypothetical protein
MNSRNTLMKIQGPLLRSLTILSLISSPAFSQNSHQHHHEELRETVKQVVKVTDKKLEVTPAVCPDPGDRAFVNFDMGHLEDPKGFHGMLFFGQGDTFYISHLPMFHKPHDYQAIVEVRLKPEVKAKYQAELKSKGGYFTFAPDDNFVLPKVVTEKIPISGKLVQGHFERGGNDLLSTDLELVRVVFYKKISANDKKPPKEKYVIFGKGDEYFMAHEVFERPNVDEIIPLPKSFPLSKELKADIQQNGLAFTDSLEIKDKKVLAKKDKETIEFPYEEFYRETGDLE